MKTKRLLQCLTLLIPVGMLTGCVGYNGAANPDSSTKYTISGCGAKGVPLALLLINGP